MDSLTAAQHDSIVSPIEAEIARATIGEVRAYLQGASRDGTFNRLHRTFRFSEADVRWLRVLGGLLERLGQACPVSPVAAGRAAVRAIRPDRLPVVLSRTARDGSATGPGPRSAAGCPRPQVSQCRWTGCRQRQGGGRRSAAECWADPGRSKEGAKDGGEPVWSGRCRREDPGPRPDRLTQVGC